MSSTTPRLRTAPVLAVLVCHDGEQWLGTALSALRRQEPRPRHVIAVDTGSTDRTARILAEASDGQDRVVDGVLRLPRGTGFGAAVHAAVEHAVERWGDPGKWLWLLHDDCAPEPDCLAALLTAADLSPGAAVLGPLALDWADPRLVVEAGVSTDSSGHRQTGVGPAELDWSRFGSGGTARFEQSTEVLAVSSAGSLVKRQVWQALGGYDRRMPLLRDDIDFGWRANRAGHLVLCVPVARMRHARAASAGLRRLDAVAARPGPLLRGVDRAHGLRTFLTNTSTPSFLLGLPRLAVLQVLRALGFFLLRRWSDGHGELGALRYLVGGRAGLLAARAARRGGKGSVRGLFTSRTTRFRNAVRAGASYLIRRRVEADVTLGRLPEDEGRPSGWRPPPSEKDGRRKAVGPDALPAGVLGRGHPARATGGLRRPATAVPVITEAVLPPTARPSPRPRPSPVPRDARPEPELVFVEVDRARVLRSLLVAPPLLLVLGLTLFALVANSGRLGFDLSGGRLLPVGDLGATWSEYLAAWHPVSGGTTSPASASLAVLGTLGVLFGGPATLVALVLLFDAPIAALAAYVATRRMRVRRPVRAVVAAAYALLPAATSAVSQGRLDVVVVHVLAPLVFTGVLGVLRGAGGRAWLPIVSGTAFAAAAIGAFSPLVHLAVVVGALVGFVVLPGNPGEGRRRVAGLFAVVLLPMALLLPWPAVVLQNPVVVLHGVGAVVDTPAVGPLDLVALRPGGPGALPFVGALVVLAALGGLALRPNRAMLPGLGVVVLGVLTGAALLAVPMSPLSGGPARYGFTGAPLVLLGWGLLWVVLAACRRDGPPASARVRHLVSLVGVLAVLGLAVSGLLGLRQGPLRAGTDELPSTVAQELPRTGRAVLVLGANGEPTRQVAGRTPSFGDDDLVPTSSSPARLNRWTRDLTSGTRDTARLALAQAATAGVAFVVPPDGPTADKLRSAVGDLVADAPSTSDGRPVLRVQLAAGNAVLLSPELARRARSGGDPPTELGVPGIAPVEAGPPVAGVRVSEGPEGRVLVLAAEDEPSWRATVDGRPAPVSRVWGHQVGVTVPTTASDVRVEAGGSVRELLLLLQGAAALFALLTAIPSRGTTPRR
ncbi:glycosyltransferase [Umezawaea tangerina]|uniref:glycosyltransferase n=1 Tax=Umezawaea tangerina TaxID=84725 RepID=UPI00318386DA